MEPLEEWQSVEGSLDDEDLFEEEVLRILQHLEALMLQMLSKLGQENYLKEHGDQDCGEKQDTKHITDRF